MAVPPRTGRRPTPSTPSGGPAARRGGAVGALVARRWTVVAVHLGLVLVALAGLPRLRDDNTPSAFLPDDDPALRRHAALTEEFGSDELLRIVVPTSELRRPGGRDALEGLRRAVERLPHVESVLGPADVVGDAGPLSLEAWLDAVAAAPMGRSLELVAADRSFVTFLVTFEPLEGAAIGEVASALAEVEQASPLAVAAAGPLLLNQALDDSSKEIARKFFPLVLLATALMLLAVFRRPGGVVVPLAYVGAVEASLLGVMGWAGVAMNLVLAILPPLVLVIALATSVHVLVRMRHLGAGGATGRAAVVAAWGDKGWAIFWTGATTAFGFLSLATSPVPPVRALGLWAAAGLALATVFAFTLLPALASWIAPEGGEVDASRGTRLEARLRALGRGAALASLRRRRLVLLAFLGVGALAAAGLPRVAVESHALSYLRPDHPVRAEIERLEAAGVGVTAFEVVVDAGDGDLRSDDALDRLARLGRRLRGEPRVLGVAGVGDVLDEARVRLGEDGALASPAELLDVVLESEEGPTVLGRFLTGDGRRARLTVFVPMLGYSELDPVVAAALADADALISGGVHATGQLLLLNDLQRRLIATLLVSLSLTLACVGAVFFALLRSLELALLALLPNAWPVVVTLGFMGWTGVGLDVSTVMVASIALGLAVDDTIHTLAHFRRLVSDSDRSHALVVTLERTAPAYVLSGAILVTGFGSCLASSFLPTAHFGGLSILAITLAVLGDLLLVPALLGGASRAATRRVAERRSTVSS